MEGKEEFTCCPGAGFLYLLCHADRDIPRERALSWMVYAELLWLWAVAEIEKP